MTLSVLLFLSFYSWGLVGYADPRDADRAIKVLTGTELKGRKIFVREDRDGSGSAHVNTDRGPAIVDRGRGDIDHGHGGVDRGYGGVDRGYGNMDRGYSQPAPRGMSYRATKLYVGNLSWDVKWQDLKDHFKCCGQVVRADVLEGPDGAF